MSRFISWLGDLRGSVGSVTFSRNKSGGVMRLKTSGVNRNTLKQAQVRNRFTSANAGWHTLTDEQKASWSSASKNSNLTGQQYFNSLKMNKLKFAEAFFANDNFFRTSSFLYDTIVPPSHSNFAPSTPVAFSFNNNTQFFERADFLDRFDGSPTSRYKFRFLFRPNSNYPLQPFTSSDPFKDAYDVRYGLIVYAKILGAQKSENINNRSFMPFVSCYSSKRASDSTLLVQSLFLGKTVNALQLRMNKLGINGKEVVLRFSLQYEDGREFVLNEKFVQLPFLI